MNVLNATELRWLFVLCILPHFLKFLFFFTTILFIKKIFKKEVCSIPALC